MKNKESLVHTSLFLTTRFNHACAQDVGWGGGGGGVVCQDCLTNLDGGVYKFSSVFGLKTTALI